MQKWSKHPAAAIKVAFVLFDQFSNMCLANCLEPMRAANTLAHQCVFDWSFLTLDGAAVHLKTLDSLIKTKSIIIRNVYVLSH